jgi:hypothetical protein
MRFWDASAIAPLLCFDAPRDSLVALLEEDAEMLVWWGTPVEVVAALARREREGAITATAVAQVSLALHALEESWQEVLPSDPVRRAAERLLRVHPLRAADSLQLAAATVAADHDPSSLELVSLDARLNEAARREGFRVLDLARA